jgi:uncharacterized membrane protein YbhN (UPF0104 family)
VTEVAPADETESTPPASTSRLRQISGFVVLAVVLGGVALTVARNWRDFVHSMHQISVTGAVLSLVFGIVGVGGTFMEWRAVLRGLGVNFGVRDGAQVFFVSQLGKYLPGSVWPIVIQMEAGRTRGASRRTMLAANLVTVVLGLATGVVIAGALLPFSYPSALHRFWWALAALPLVLVLAHPRSMPFLLDGALRLVHRPPLGVQMSAADTARASAWAMVGWIGLGLHLAVLVAAMGKPTAGLYVLCIGAMGLAVTAGILFIPAPAGAGLREVVLGYVLVVVVTSGQALAVVVASRVLLIAADLLLAAVFGLTRARQSTVALRRR